MLIEGTTVNPGFFSAFSIGCDGGKLATKIEESSLNVTGYGVVSHASDVS